MSVGVGMRVRAHPCRKCIDQLRSVNRCYSLAGLHTSLQLHTTHQEAEGSAEQHSNRHADSTIQEETQQQSSVPLRQYHLRRVFVFKVFRF